MCLKLHGLTNAGVRIQIPVFLSLDQYLTDRFAPEITEFSAHAFKTPRLGAQKWLRSFFLTPRFSATHGTSTPFLFQEQTPRRPFSNAFKVFDPVKAKRCSRLISEWDVSGGRRGDRGVP